MPPPRRPAPRQQPKHLLNEILKEEALRRGLIGQRIDKWERLETETFPKQREYILDESPRSTLCTPRRAAKTETVVRKMLRTVKRKPFPGKTGTRSVYISMTRDNAKRNVWSRLQVMNNRYEIGMKPNHSDLILTDPATTSDVWVTGLANQKEIAKLRGGEYDYVHVDEAQDIVLNTGARGDGFEDFIMSVILPALGDRRGQLSVSGTPDPFRRNPWWFNARNSDHKRWDHWKKFGWSLFDNVFFPEPQKYLAEIRENEGYHEDDPRYQAEYLGLWPQVSSHLCIDGYEPGRSDFVGDPDSLTAANGYEFLMGLDPGYKDATAYVVAAYSTVKRHIVFVESEATQNTIVADMARTVEKFMKKYPIHSVVVDEQGMGKTVALELVERFGLPVQPAEKKDKRMRLAFLNSDLRTGRAQVVARRNIGLTGQWQTVMWDRDHEREMEGQTCDLFDAAGYAHIACRSFLEAESPRVPADEGEQYWEEQIERARAKREGWGFDGK